MKENNELLEWNEFKKEYLTHKSIDDLWDKLNEILSKKNLRAPKEEIEAVHEYKWYIEIDQTKYYSECYLTCWEVHDPTIIMIPESGRVRVSGIRNELDGCSKQPSKTF